MTLKTKRPQQGVQGVEIGLHLAFELAKSRGPMALGDLARAAGLPASKAHRYLVSLCRSGLVEQDARSGRYDLGRGALVLGLEAQRRLDEFRLADAALDELFDLTQLTVGLVIWGDQGPTVVRRKEGVHAVTVSTRVGSHMSVLSTSAGQMFAAYLPRRVVEPFIKAAFAANSGPSAGPNIERASYEALLAEIREKGWSRRRGDSYLGIDAVCAPVFDREGALEMVITVMGARGAVDLEPESPAVQALVKTTKSLSERLGHLGSAG